MGKMNSKAIFSSNSDEWTTPQELYEKLDEEFAFTLDPCSTDENAKCVFHYTKSDDGLQKSWGGRESICKSTLFQHKQVG